MFVINRAILTVTPGPGASGLLDLVIIPDAHGVVPGAPLFVFNDLAIPGLTNYDYRLAFGGRSGGAFTGADLDNIAFTAVPEPASLTWLGIAGLGLLARRAR